MVSDDLMKRLLDWFEYDEGKINDARKEAADRIEALQAQLAKAREDATRYRYVLEGVRGAIKTGRNEPLMIWRDQIDIALDTSTPTPAPDQTGEI
jgi:hypothetical protein